MFSNGFLSQPRRPAGGSESQSSLTALAGAEAAALSRWADYPELRARFWIPAALAEMFSVAHHGTFRHPVRNGFDVSRHSGILMVGRRRPCSARYFGLIQPLTHGSPRAPQEERGRAQDPGGWRISKNPRNRGLTSIARRDNPET